MLIALVGRQPDTSHLTVDNLPECASATGPGKAAHFPTAGFGLPSGLTALSIVTSNPIVAASKAKFCIASVVVL